MVKLASHGRGTAYSPLRGVMESVLGLAYAGDWPARLYGRFAKSRRVRASRHALALLAPGAPSLRIAFVSDVHLGPTTADVTVEQAFALLRDAAPDVLLLGGDYVFLEATAGKARRLASLVASVPTPHKFAVLGNHDLWSHHGLLEDALLDAGVTMLVNRRVALPAPWDAVLLAGVDDPWTGVPDPSVTEGATVVLCHAPEVLPLLVGGMDRLVVCGHTHGGHVALPGGPLYVPGPVGTRYSAGMYRAGKTNLFVSRGVGATEMVLRTFAEPDVGIFDLVAQ